MSEFFLISLEEEIFVNSSYFKNPSLKLKLIKQLYSSISSPKFKNLTLQNIRRVLLRQYSQENVSSNLFNLEKELELLVLMTVQNFNDIYLYYTINLLIIEEKIFEELYDFIPFEINNSMNEVINDCEKEKILLCDKILTDLEYLIVHIQVISVLILKKNYMNMISSMNEKLFSNNQIKLVNHQIFKVIWETLFLCYRGIFVCERKIFINEDTKYEEFCNRLKNLAMIFLENYYYTLRWSQNEICFSQTYLEKNFIMSFIIISHSLEQKFMNNLHYHDFHSRFVEFFEMTEYFYSQITVNLKRYLKYLNTTINQILKNGSLSKSNIQIKIVQHIFDFEKDPKLKINAYMLSLFNQSLKKFLLISTVHSYLNDNLYEVIPRNFWFINLLSAYVYGDIIEKLLQRFYVAEKRLIERYEILLSNGNLLIKNDIETNGNNIILYDNSNGTESLNIIVQFDTEIKESLFEILETYFKKMIKIFPKRLFLVKESLNCFFLKIIFENKDLFMNISKRVEKTTTFKNILEKLSLCQGYYNFYYCEYLLLIFYKNHYTPKLRIIFPDTSLNFIDIEGKKKSAIKDTNDENTNNSNFNIKQQTAKSFKNPQRSVVEEGSKIKVNLNEISQNFPNGIKLIDSQKVSQTNKKTKKEIILSKFYPGCILAHIPAQDNTESNYILLDKENFEKIEGKDWFNKKEMEELVSLNEDFQSNDVVKYNYKNLFHFYDCEESLKYTQVEENIYYVLN